MADCWFVIKTWRRGAIGFQVKSLKGFSNIAREPGAPIVFRSIVGRGCTIHGSGEVGRAVVRRVQSSVTRTLRFKMRQCKEIKRTKHENMMEEFMQKMQGVVNVTGTWLMNNDKKDDK
ncbi:hypothetical protein WN51_14130 [Melipona quadrifasciata]|uniref:Uncharacterized protein n=1 Tax=Melipona quadrifasciata TaxID=166423 RepID=A0A0M8ZZ39_9HYME|nr:hypothetical protein WN51_14130 [Melipona quadrifasciata]